MATSVERKLSESGTPKGSADWGGFRHTKYMPAMESSWLALCAYGFLKELRPSEPFLTEYLIDEKGPNVTLAEAYSDVYPVWTYSYLALLVLVFLFTDLLRYKPLIVLEGLAYVVTWLLLLFGKGVACMQWMQVRTSMAIFFHTL